MAPLAKAAEMAGSTSPTSPGSSTSFCPKAAEMAGSTSPTSPGSSTSFCPKAPGKLTEQAKEVAVAGGEGAGLTEELARTQAATQAQVRAMGSLLLSEANDLKRPLHIVAQELGVALETLTQLLEGHLGLPEAMDVLHRMSELYPVPLRDLWLDRDDRTAGARICTAEEAEATSRVLDRLNRDGARTPYYEYRDCAMTRCSQFRPEWIKELRCVTSGDVLDPDVQLNNGHLLMQATLFVGPVDYYYKDNAGVVHRKEMNTGDSCFIMPYIPHSFTTRDESTQALIIAVTFGGSVRRALSEFGRIGAKEIFAMTGDLRDKEQARQRVLQRNLDNESMSVEEFASALAPRIDVARVSQLVAGAEPTYAELEAVAAVLSVRVSDLLVVPIAEDQEMIITRASQTSQHARWSSTYKMVPLSRCPHVPQFKMFDLEVLDSAAPGEELKCGLHTFVYHFGSEDVDCTWSGDGGEHSTRLRPGDSVYFSPAVPHRFSTASPRARNDAECRPNPNGAARGEGRRLLIVRIPGHLTGDTLGEFATFSRCGRERAGAETMRWYS